MVMSSRERVPSHLATVPQDTQSGRPDKVGGRGECIIRGTVLIISLSVFIKHPNVAKVLSNFVFRVVPLYNYCYYLLVTLHRPLSSGWCIVKFCFQSCHSLELFRVSESITGDVFPMCVFFLLPFD